MSVDLSSYYLANERIACATARIECSAQVANVYKEMAHACIAKAQLAVQRVFALTSAAAMRLKPLMDADILLAELEKRATIVINKDLIQILSKHQSAEAVLKDTNNPEVIEAYVKKAEAAAVRAEETVARGEYLVHKVQLLAANIEKTAIQAQILTIVEASLHLL